METLEPVFFKLGDRIASMHKVSFPPCTKCDVDYHTYVDLWNFGIYAMMAAARDGKLWMPEKPEQGTPLTLVIVR